MVSAWKMDDTITVFLTAVEMCEADRCLPWHWQFFPKLQMSHGGWHCNHGCWAASRQPKSVAAPGTHWQPHPAGACWAGPWRQQRQVTALTETCGLPTLICLQIWHFGGKKESLLLAEFPAPVCWELADPPQGWQGFLLPGCAGLLEVSPGCLQTAWLKIPAGLELHLHQGKCWWVCLKNMGEVESRREVEQFVSVHKLLRPDATTALSFYEMWWRGVLLPAWQELRSQWHCDHRYCCWATLSLAKTWV